MAGDRVAKVAKQIQNSELHSARFSDLGQDRSELSRRTEIFCQKRAEF